MSFNSVEFMLLLAVVLALHWTVRPNKRNLVVLAASYVFYGWWDWRFLGLLMVSTVTDFVIARLLAGATHERQRRALLATSLVVNLGLLAAFKYAGFFVDSFVAAFSSLGLSSNPVLLQIVLPVGISFYTFQTISYTFDVFRRRIQPTTNLVTFATYVAYFPQLVAGPIERAQNLLPQISDRQRRFPRGDRLFRAGSLILFGLFQKIVLADGVAAIVNDAFVSPGEQSWLTLSAAAVGFSIQIYGDFSGYSNIARGVSLLLGIELMTNFREPYLSRTITEFWQRWHISLSTWLRDYLYVPLGGNRGRQLQTLRNLMVTMLLGGLWHGASWNFVIWGGLHGLYLVVDRLRGRPAPVGDPAARQIPAVIGTFGLITMTWVFFRADTLTDAVTVLGRIVTFGAGTWSVADALTVLFLGLMMLALDLAQRAQLRVDRPLVTSPVRAGALTGLVLVGILVFSGGTPEPFIYFQF